MVRIPQQEDGLTVVGIPQQEDGLTVVGVPQQDYPTWPDKVVGLAITAGSTG